MHPGIKLILPLALSLAASAQTLVSSRATSDGGTATFRPPVSVGTPIQNGQFYREMHEVQVRVLADGTQSSQTSRLQRVWRDSRGRTRVERFYIIPGVEPDTAAGVWPTAEIEDPVDGFWYVLDKEKKIAHRGALKILDGVPTLGSNTAYAASGAEDLGTQIIDGVSTTGRRTSRTLPNAGNGLPQVATTEIWTARELELTMLVKLHGPRNADSITDFRNFSRAQPDPNLFAPPVDYKIADETGPFSISWGKPLTFTPPAAEVPAGTYRIGGGVSAPKPTFTVDPTYTEEARQAKVEGTVLLQIVVGEDGKAHNLRITKTLDPGLDQKAIEAVEQCASSRGRRTESRFQFWLPSR